MATPIGIAGFTSAQIAPTTTISQNGIPTSKVGGSVISPRGTYLPVSKPKKKPNKWGSLTGDFKPSNINNGIGIGPSPVPTPNVPGGNDQPPKYGKIPKVPSWADADYNQQMNAIARALNLYKANMGVQRQRAGEQYALSSRDMDQSKVRDLRDMEEDFASRGIVRSGVYGTSVGDYNTEWGQQKAGLDSQYKNSLTDINMAYQEYLNEIKTQREQAKLDAVRRAAQKKEENPPTKKKATTPKKKK